MLAVTKMLSFLCTEAQCSPPTFLKQGNAPLFLLGLCTFWYLSVSVLVVHLWQMLTDLSD